MKDLGTYVRVGRVLWVNPERSRLVGLETLTAASLIVSQPEKTVDRATSGLLDRAKYFQRGPLHEARSADDVEQRARLLDLSFFRLPPEARVAMVCLTAGRWSYARIAGVLRVAPAEVEKIAWNARLSLGLGGAVPYPMAPLPGADCPEYNVDAPWTQRFLDDEMITAKDRLALQRHLLECENCAQALSRCRTLYYRAEAEMNKVLDQLEQDPEPETGRKPRFLEEAKFLEKAIHASAIRKPLWERSFAESLVLFLQKRDVFWVILISGSMLGLYLLSFMAVR